MNVDDLKLNGADMRAFVGDFPTPDQYGASGDGVTDDTVPLTACMTANPSNRIYGRKGPYYTPALTDTVGANFDPSGQVVEGHWIKNSYAHETLKFGGEYLYGWFGKLTARTPVTIALCGDSTVEGGANPSTFTNSDRRLMENFALLDGYTGVTVHDHSHSGMTYTDWDTTYVGAEVAEGHDLWIIRYGVNDLRYKYSMSTIGASLRSALTKIRTAFPISSGVGIVLMSTNDGWEVSGTRDFTHVRMEQLVHLLKQCCSEFGCGFVDSYAAFQCVKDQLGSGRWFDEAGPIFIHPDRLASKMLMMNEYDFIFPSFTRLYTTTLNPKRIGDIITPSVTVGMPTGAVFYVHGETSINADFVPNHGLIPYLSTGGVTPLIVNNKIRMLSGTSVCWNNSLPNATSGNIMTVRWMFTPEYDNHPVGSLILFSQYTTNSASDNYMYVSQTSSGNIACLIRAGGVDVLSTTFAVYTAVSGTEVEMEFDMDLTAGEERFFLDGVQLGVTKTAVGVRAYAQAFQTGFDSYNDEIRSYRHISVFPTVQHTANYVPLGANRTLITNDSVTCPAVTTSGLVTTNTLTTISDAGVGGDLDVTGALTVNGGTVPSFTSTTFDLTCSAVWDPTTIVVTVELSLSNGTVTCHIPTISDTATTASYIYTAPVIPAGYRPLAIQQFPVIVSDNSVLVPGMLRVSTAGGILIYVGTSTDFANTGVAGMNDITVQWKVAP
jgi:hypothetical protein